ncbi:Cytochrome c-type protein TorC [Magnetospirillum sp. XM-1]|uniref:NapC/NirT family cytochrome c n=1 Tax=Magnetospirillum sp. XM-1 TaxID=1663591 RepID=UPI00073DE6FF|nr:NapC/NirT family cytochrome c [Magnetospirillum sp. XM-1]CUW40731.1 Cytochrome c-type protein TorC [Magnetospirillum sp. XM-1]
MRKVIWGLAWMLAGVVAWGGFNTALEATNTTSFCISCHVMRDTVYVEYRQSAHFQNRSGVRAGCPDCHVPRDWNHKLIRKAQASNELFHWALGSIDTPEKFEAKRHDLAAREWTRMRESDSRECRNCHSFEAMDFHKQSMKAARAMREAAKAGKTCIDCHKAVAHKMPDVTLKHRAMLAALSAEARNTVPAVGDVVYAVEPRMLRSRPDAEPVGELAAAVPVRVLAVAGDSVEIEIAAWVRDGTPAVLYSRFGKRMAVASLTEAAQSVLESGETKEDADTGQAWTAQRLRAWAPAAGWTRDPERLWAYGERMVQDNCTLCHTRRSPGEYTADAWIGHFNMMRRLVPLDDSEAAFLLTYLQGRAGDMVP